MTRELETKQEDLCQCDSHTQDKNPTGLLQSHSFVECLRIPKVVQTPPCADQTAAMLAQKLQPECTRTLPLLQIFKKLAKPLGAFGHQPPWPRQNCSHQSGKNCKCNHRRHDDVILVEVLVQCSGAQSEGCKHLDGKLMITMSLSNMWSKIIQSGNLAKAFSGQ